MSTTANFEAVKVLSESAYNSLSSTPDNTLHFVELPMEAYITETYHNGSSWYRVYSDGWCEQGGYQVVNPKTGTITLLKPFRDTNYNISTAQGQLGVDSANSAYTTDLSISTNSTLYYASYDTNAVRNIFWRACGYIN